MKKIDIGQTITILANLGVIAGIVFLGIELQQNNRFLAAEARLSLIEQRGSALEVTIDPFVLESLHKYAAGETLTPAERSAAFAPARKNIELWEWQYGEYESGMLELDQLSVAAWRLWYRGDPTYPVPIREVWEEREQALNPNFVRFFRENVINP
jgi:hypothetical protein